MKDHGNRRIFVCPLLPNEVVNKYGASFAANNFCNNMLSDHQIFDEVLVTLPVRPVEYVDLKYVKLNVFSAYYKRFRKSAKLSRFAFIPEAYQMFKKIGSCDSVWYYNLAYTVAVLFILVKIFKRTAKQYIIVLDYTPGRKGVKGLMESFLLWLINKADGAILLAPNKIFTCKQMKCLPGVVPCGERKEPRIEKLNNRFLLSGVLSERIAQLSMVLKAFSQMPQCELHITGSVDDDSEIKGYVSKCPNIIHHGKVSFSEYLDIMHTCTFQLSTRHPDYPENQCNFPSKIIETLLHNRIIISTIEYPQLNGIKYFKVDSDSESFLQQIYKISSLGKETLMDYANQGRKVAEMFSTKMWNDAMTKIENAI